MIGRFFCRIGLHRWGPWFVTTYSPMGMTLYGCHARDCQRKDCGLREYDLT